MATVPSYEALGSFYLGREYDAERGTDRPDLLLYDSRDLTTHAVCVGMTGSGKTGLCLSLLEEAAIDGVPAIAIDPKGDLGNLLLSFPSLQPEDFAPWIDAGAAARQGISPEEAATKTAETWRKGLADWDQDGTRIARFREAVDIAIYTPGSEAGRPLSVLQSFAAPPEEQRLDAGASRERVSATVGGLLGLAGIEADPLQSREHILLSTLFDQAWTAGRDLSLAALIQGIQKPPFDKVGVFDLETFYPAKERMQLAMSLNNLIASPSFAAWMKGEPLDVQRLLFTADGKPRISVISIAHLGDAERMFVVTLLLGEVVAWMRRQSGTSSLRAMLYMDEIFGYFPPSAMPPSKLPLLTLMKQARAFGLGVVLATQNPVDLDYKGLSNAGTWFIGRLQTERDKARVIDGLLGAAGEGLDKAQLEKLLANLGNRVFLMRNVHDAAPVLFRTRWTLSYLRGPLTLQEIAKLSRAAPSPDVPSLTSPAPARATRREFTAAAAETSRASQGTPISDKPVIPAGVDELYLETSQADATYLPRVLGIARLHFVDKAAGLDVWETRSLIAPLDDSESHVDWSQADVGVGGDLQKELSNEPPQNARYAEAPAALLRAQNYRSWQKELATHLYSSSTLPIFHCPTVGQSVAPGTSEGDFRAKLSLALREKRDAEIEKLRKKYAPKLATLQDQLRRADERVERERSDLSQHKVQTAISVGTSILGALLGRKAISVGNAQRAGSAARSAGRLSKESGDIDRAEENREVIQQRLTEMQSELESEVSRLRSELDPATVTIEQTSVKPRKTDIDVRTVALLWVPN
ncbi:ATP-binding protein [Steroidobacter agaridevorans]|uniref:ATP-binding protein n=1 Tax=Steroidobacter agaridevorans TaxID=2695856 RepID=A0A829Y6D1_9GAMM|nr:ATP-binding protein [Steroidobacter agaridevorans]GFE78525.1 ATP-binding protein [Steroidobacter agaridevorans]